MKKFLALVLALIMVMSLTAVSFADGEDPGTDPDPAADTCWIKAPENSTHTYVAYQIFTGDLHDGVLSNIIWGDGVKSDYYTHDEIVTPAADVAADLTEVQLAAEFADLLTAKENDSYKYLQNVIEFTEGKADVVPGYYLIMDAEGTVPPGHAYTRYILNVVGKVELDPKESWPTSHKNQSTSEHPYSDPSAYLKRPVDVNIGDKVYYEVTGTVPGTLADYATYKYCFHDTMSNGLTFAEDSVKVHLVHKDTAPDISVADEPIVDITEHFTVSPLVATADGKAFTIGIENLKEISNLHSTDLIVVTYYATLNENAVIGNPGEKNTSYLEFSNNPNHDGSGNTGSTPPETVYAFTFQLNVNKTNNAGDPLPGAKFKLKHTDNQWAKIVDGKITGWVATEAEATELTTTLVGEAPNQHASISIAGLDVGTYYLVETVAPAGFNLLGHDFKVVIDATYAATFDSIATLTITHESTSGDATTMGDIATGTVSVRVVNTPGTALPSTGGIGTTLFYVIGSVLMLGAAVLLIVKKRMNNM